MKLPVNGTEKILSGVNEVRRAQKLTREKQQGLEIEFVYDVMKIIGEGFNFCKLGVLPQ